MTPGTPDLTSLRAGGPANADQWLARIKSGKALVPGPSYLYGVGEVAAFEARKNMSDEWARVAVHAYELQANIFPESKDSALNHAMRLRVWLISKLGPRSGDQLLDVAIIGKWFLTELPFTFEEVQSKVKAWKAEGERDTLSLEDMRKLRGIKNMLTVMKHLVDSGNLPHDVSLDNWLAIHKDLP